MTRDSKLLRILQLAAIVLAVMAATITDPAAYGLSPITLKWLALISTIVGTIAGWLGTSPLPGGNDASTIKPSNIPVILLATAIGAGAIGFSACGGKAPATLPASTAAVVQTGDARLKALADRALGTLDAAGALLDQVIDVEKKIEPMLPPSGQANARAAMHAVNDSIAAAAKGIAVGVQSEAALKALLKPVISTAQSLVSLVGTFPAPAQSSGGFGAVVNALFSIVFRNLGNGGAPALQGAAS